MNQSHDAGGINSSSISTESVSIHLNGFSTNKRTIQTSVHKQVNSLDLKYENLLIFYSFHVCIFFFVFLFFGIANSIIFINKICNNNE